MRPTDRTCCFSHADRVLFDAHRDFPYETTHPRTENSAMDIGASSGKSGRKRKKSKNGRQWEKERKKRLKESIEKKERRKKKSCKVESRVGGAPSWGAMLLTDFAYTSFSLLHGSVFDQSNGIFSRLLDGRDPGDIGHFLVAIRQWKPPTVKTTGKRKKKRKIREKSQSCVSLSSGELLSRMFSVSRLHHRHRILPPSSHLFVSLFYRAQRATVRAKIHERCNVRFKNCAAIPGTKTEREKFRWI